MDWFKALIGSLSVIFKYEPKNILNGNQNEIFNKPKGPITVNHFHGGQGNNQLNLHNGIPQKTEIEKPKEDTNPKSNPKVIIEEIKSSKPYMRKEISKSFEGLEVKWKLNFRAIDIDEVSGLANVSLSQDIGVWVNCKVKLEEYPELKTIQENAGIQVTGKVEEIYVGLIYVKDAELKF